MITNTPHCEYNGCNQPAKYELFKTHKDGRKVWLKVCKGHEKVIGLENLERARGYAGK